jgi:hypothetical protein
MLGLDILLPAPRIAPSEKKRESLFRKLPVRGQGDRLVVDSQWTET